MNKLERAQKELTQCAWWEQNAFAGGVQKYHSRWKNSCRYHVILSGSTSWSQIARTAPARHMLCSLSRLGVASHLLCECALVFLYFTNVNKLASLYFLMKSPEVSAIMNRIESSESSEAAEPSSLLRRNGGHRHATSNSPPPP